MALSQSVRGTGVGIEQPWHLKRLKAPLDIVVYSNMVFRPCVLGAAALPNIHTHQKPGQDCLYPISTRPWISCTTLMREELQKCADHTDYADHAYHVFFWQSIQSFTRPDRKGGGGAGRSIFTVSLAIRYIFSFLTVLVVIWSNCCGPVACWRKSSKCGLLAW